MEDSAEKQEIRKRLQKKLQGKPYFLEEQDYQPNMVQMAVQVPLPTRFGNFTLFGFYDGYESKEHTALVKGDVAGAQRCPVRIHSECHTGDVLGSLRCDCRDQLEAALHYIGQQKLGALIYVRQEGRGIGLFNKLRAYVLQDLGLDTFEANQYLGFPPEARSYVVAAQIINLLQIKSIALLSNNPDKITKLRQEGIQVLQRIPLVTTPSDHNAHYLETKKKKFGHLL